jgi:hypothetical protein
MRLAQTWLTDPNANAIISSFLYCYIMNRAIPANGDTRYIGIGNAVEVKILRLLEVKAKGHLLLLQILRDMGYTYREKPNK